jgi:biopolymer transport protein ExbB
MLSSLFLGIALWGAEWVLYVLVGISIVSVALMFERWTFYRTATLGLKDFRAQIRNLVTSKKWNEAVDLSKRRLHGMKSGIYDFETRMTLSALENQSGASSEKLSQLTQDSLLQSKIHWERFLTLFATISNNAPFIGLFGTVLGIIKAFHDLSAQAVGGAGAQAVSAGLSEALVATAFGILVAIPATLAFNSFNRKVKNGLQEAEALRSFLIAHLSKE